MEHRSHEADIVIPTRGIDFGNKCTIKSDADVAQRELLEEKQMGEPVNCTSSELCTFLQALAEGYLPTCYSDTDQSAPSKSMNIASRSYQQGKKTACFHGFQSLTMSLDSMASHGAASSTSSLEDSLARTSPLQEKAQDSTVNVQASGLRCLESFAKYDHEKSTWKIAQRSLFEDSEGSLEIWPRWGMTVNGESFHAETSAEFTYESGSGLSLPTTGANEGKGSQKRRYIGSPEYRGAKMSEGLRTCEEDQIYLNPSFAELAMMWPLGWSDLAPLAMARFREWQQQHSIS